MAGGGRGGGYLEQGLRAWYYNKVQCGSKNTGYFDPNRNPYPHPNPNLNTNPNPKPNLTLILTLIPP